MSNRVVQLMVILAVLRMRSEDWASAAPPPRGDPPAAAAFSRWSDHFLASTPHNRATLIAEGEWIARERQAILRQLIQSDPRRALELAVPARVRRQLPSEVQAQLEKRVSGRGEFRVLVATDFAGGRSEVRHEVVMKGKVYQASVYGRRLGQRTRRNVAFYGIAIGDRLAVHEDAVRLLEPGEFEAGNNGNELCPVSGKLATVYGTETLAEVGGQIEHFCGVNHVEALNERLAMDEGGSGSEGDPPIAQESWSQGPKTLLYMRAAFPDDPSEPITESGAYAAMDTVNNWYVENSYGTTAIIPTVTPLLMLPQTKAWYSEQGTGRLMSDAREAARADGYDTDNYHWDIVRFTSVPGFNFGGLASVHGKGTWLQSSGTGVTIHELGHNYGVWHANFWNANGDSIIATGAHNEYGDPYDPMGSASGGIQQFNAAFKSQLDWLPDGFIHVVTNSGTYRIYTYDVPNLTVGQKYAFRVKKNYDRNYWGEFRQKYTSNRWFLNGVILHWDPWNNGVTNSASGAHLLDTTPGTPAGKDDSPVVIGRTFTDPAAGVHITPIARGNLSPENWIDVVINVGQFSNNAPPVSSLLADRTTAPAGGTVNFTVMASDPDGDALAYAWDFGDTNLAPSLPNVSKNWPAAGNYVVRCTVSDMKGGVDTRSVLITVGSPATFRAIGRIVAEDGRPLEGVRVHNGLTGASYRGTYTDSDGNYTLANLAAGNHTISAVKYGYTLNRDGWSNPVALGPDANELDWIGVAAPVVNVAVTDTTASEAGADSGAFTISRTGPIGAPLVVKMNRTGSATPTTDYAMSPAPAGSPLQVTMPGGASSITILTTPASDATSEGPETVTLTLMEDTAYVLGGLAEATLVIADDDPAARPTVSVSATSPSALADNSAPESGSDSGVFTFTRSGGGVAGELIVYYSVSGTASNGVDFTGLSGVVSIAAGETVGTVSFRAIDDVEVEGDETVVVTILANAAYNGGGANSSMTIVDDDPVSVAVTATDNVLTETSGNPGVFTVTRVGNLAFNLPVSYMLGGTATNGSDYNTLSGTVTLLAGRATATITVTPINDALVEGHETVTLSLTSTAAYNVVNPGEATMVIQDNEIPTVTLSARDASATEGGTDVGMFSFGRASTNDDLIVFYDIGGTALNGVDYAVLTGSIVIPIGATNANLTVTPLDDAWREDGETVRLTLKPDATYNVGTLTTPSVTINDNDSGALPSVGFTFAESSGSESVTTARLSVSLSSATYTAPATVNYAVTGGSASGSGVDYTLASGSLSFTNGDINRTITIAVVNDTAIETNETITVTLSSPANAQLDSNASHVYMILDDDASGTVGITPIDGVAVEGSADVGRIRISRTTPTADPLTVYFEVVGSASAPSDFLPVGDSVTIPAGGISADVVITPVDDATDEPNETVTLNLTRAPGAKLNTTDTATVTIVDDDSSANSPIVAITATDPLASEPGADTGTFTVMRDRSTNDALTVSFTVGGSATSGTDYFAVGSSVVIPAGESAATVTITPRDDAAFETNETVTLTLTLLSGYRVGAASSTVTLVDNESGVFITGAGSSAEDGSSTGAFTLTRTGSSDSNLTVNLLIAGNADAASDFQTLSNAVVIPAGTNAITIPLVANDDALPEGHETVVVTVASGAGYNVIAPSSATVLILDDEPAVSVVAEDSTASEAPGNSGLFTFVRTGNTNGDLSVEFTVAGTAGNGVDYAIIASAIVIPSGESSVSLAILPLDDEETEGNETVSITLATNSAYAVSAPASALVTIVDDEVNLAPEVAIVSPTVDRVYLATNNLLLVLEATASDDGNPSNALVTTWTRPSGPGSVVFGHSNELNTTARFPINGLYVLRLTADDGQLQTFKDLSVVVGPVGGTIPGLVAWWRFDETNGTVATDSSGSNRNATVSGATWYRAGRFNYALDFDGVDDMASFSSPALTQFTLSAWAYSDSRGESTTPRVIDMPGYNVRIRRDTASTQNALAMESQRSTTAGEWRTPGETVLDGGWYHLVVAYDSSSTQNAPVFYINGTNQPATVRTTPVGTQTPNNGTGYIGNSAALDRSYDGRIDEVRLFNRMLTASEVQTLYSGTPANLAPLADAGTNQTISLGDQVTLRGAVSDDAKPNPPGITVVAWSKFSGPGNVTFGDEMAEETLVAFSESGVYVLRLAADDGEVKVLDEVTITVLDLPPWDAWRLVHFTSAELGDALISGEQADPDGDGLVNLLEYAWDLDPKTAAETNRFSGAVENGPQGVYYVVSFTRRKAPTDLVYTVEVSVDLETWQSSPNLALPLATIDDGNGITETARYRILPAVTDGEVNQRFVRLRIIRQ